MKKRMKTKLIVFAVSTGFGILAHELIEKLMNDKWQFIAIGLVVFGDFVFGFLRAWRRNELESRKGLRSVFKLGSYWFLLSLVLTVEMGYPALNFLSEAIMLPIIAFQFISILKNMEQLDLISDKTLTKILSRIDKYKEE